MKVLTGHLTQTNKTHIKLMIDKELTQAKVNRINYFLILENGIYTVKTAIKDKGYSDGYATSKATFKI